MKIHRFQIAHDPSGLSRTEPILKPRMIEHYLSCLPQDLRLNENLKGLSLTFDSKDSSDSLITYVEIPAETDGKVVHDLLVEALFSINGRTDGLNFVATPMLGREQ